MVGVFCVVGGLIAYFADALGRHLGKTRKSLFGLRPRHTAALLTTTAGVLVPLVTVFLMAIVSTEIRTILREGSRLTMERDRVVRQLENLGHDLKDAREQVKTESGHVQELEKKRAQTEGELKTKANELKNVSGELAKVRGEVQTLRHNVDLFRGQVEKAKHQASALNASIRTMRSSYSTLKTSYTSLSTTFETQTKLVQDLNSRQTQLDLQARGLERKIDDYQKRVRELEKSESEAKDELARIQARSEQARTEMRNQLESARLELDRTRGDLESLTQMSQLMRSNIDNARTRPMIFKFGEELARGTIAASASAADAQAAFTTLVRSARLQATQNGAGRDQSEPSAGLAEFNNGGRIVTVAEQEADLIKSMTGKNEALAMTANALWNSFAGEYVPLRITVRPNPVVYETGHIIAESRIDGSKSREEILAQITQFLVQGVSNRAKSDGMIPAAGRDAQFGQIESEVIIKLVEDIQGTSRIIRLQAVARQSTRAADPLRLEFRIR